VDDGPRGAAPTFGPRCFLCGAEDLAAFGEAPPARWVRCRACGLVRQDEPPPASVTQRQYGFSPLHGRGSYPAAGGEAPRPDPHVFFKHWIVGRALTAHGLTGRLVDVGCGNGLLQRHLESLGWTGTVGVEPSGDPTGRERLDLEIYNESVDDFLRRPGMAGGFDVAVAHHVIEHTYEPLEFVRQLRDLLRPGGHALLATPNIHGASMRWKTLASRLGWKARPFRHLDYPKHLVLFHPGTLERLLRAAGFEIEDLQTYTRASGDSAGPRRLSLWDRLRLGDNMYVLARRPSS
jgi:2-polyprenyl-3-methyl-5-hydroxy-6-metoxy-1,4-benzoquinol methylase